MEAKKKRGITDRGTNSYKRRAARRENEEREGIKSEERKGRDAKRQTDTVKRATGADCWMDVRETG